MTPTETATAQRSVVLASADTALRWRLRETLAGMRWRVREAGGGAEAMAQIEDYAPEALMVDTWLPDLEVSEFAVHIRSTFPGVDLLRMDGGAFDGDAGQQRAHSPRRHELLHALRKAQHESPLIPQEALKEAPAAERPQERPQTPGEVGSVAPIPEATQAIPATAVPLVLPVTTAPELLDIPELIGSSAPMLELARLIRLVAPRSTSVLIEGETGTGKEVVAKALHRLGSRATKPFTVLNCAAIPEALLEAELFGHTRGAFTGAVQSRTGRIEAANGGTLFLDEIGEMPLALQAKMLRFLESGEIQRVGDNDVMRVDVRILAATHQPLAERSAAGTFRLDLYHRLAVFPLEIPPLRERLEDIPALAEHLLAALGKDAPRKRLSPQALERLQQHVWPGNVRELAHVLERAAILAGDAAEIGPFEVRYRSKPREIDAGR